MTSSVPFIRAAVGAACVVACMILTQCGGGGGSGGNAAPPTERAVAVAFTVRGAAVNVDDACFWQDREDPARSLLLITGKSSATVDAFRAFSGEHVATIRDFGLPNNCAVASDLLLTTDRGAGLIRVHHLPDLTPAASIGADLLVPYGIDVATTSGGPVAYVTDEPDASVHVYDVASGALLDVFPTGFGDGIEPILVDLRYGRVFVARGEDEGTRAIGVFNPEGERLDEIGAGIFAGDVEGLVIYACGDGGYLIAADQRQDATEFELFDRITLQHLGAFTLVDDRGLPTRATDGIDVLQAPVPGFPGGIFAACDGCGSTDPEGVDVVAWDRIATATGLAVCPAGVAAATSAGPR